MLKFEALGTHWFIEIYDNPTQTTHDLILATVKDFETRYSRFLPESEIAILNLNQFLPDPSTELQNLMQLGLSYFKNSEGIFNFAQGGLLNHKGYGLLERPVKQSPTNILDKIIISQQAIILSDPTISIDLGGFGKGYLIDKIAKQLQRLGHKYFLINGGGDLYATTQFDAPISVYLENPKQSELALAEIKLANSALCASSTFKRIWIDQNGKSQSHILNPKTSESLTSVASFISAPECALADMLATTTCINSAEDYLAKLHKQYTFNTLAVL